MMDVSNIDGYESAGISHGDEEKGKTEGVHLETFYRITGDTSKPYSIERLYTNEEFIKRKNILFNKDK